MSMLIRHLTWYRTLAVLFVVCVAILTFTSNSVSALGGLTFTQPTVSCLNGVPNVSLSWSSLGDSYTYSIQRKVGSADTKNGWGTTLVSKLTATTYQDNEFNSRYKRAVYSYRGVAYKKGRHVDSNTISVTMPECASSGTSVPQAKTVVTSPVVVPSTSVTAPMSQTAPQQLVTATVSKQNNPPVGYIKRPTSATSSVIAGTALTFTGYGSDKEGPITAYEWRMGNCSTGNILSTDSSFSKSDFSLGTTYVYFRVKDNAGVWSTNCQKRAIIVTSPVVQTSSTVQALSSAKRVRSVNVVPVATISIPTLATTTVASGTMVTFTGAATDADGTISAYEWREGSCSVGSLLSYTATFTKLNFSVGTHRVYLRVKDNVGAWSTNCPSRTIIVTAPVVTPPPTSTKFPSWMKWGAYVGWQDTAMSNFETLTGKQPQMEAVFTHWGNDQFPAYYAPRIRDKGRTMVIFWEALDYNRDYFSQPEYSFDSVIAGNMDPYFKKFAADAKAYGGEVIIAPYSEFNGDWYPWGVSLPGNSPAKFIQAWIHIRTIFADVPNVKFAWVPNNDSVPEVSVNNFELSYPGSQYVDIVGLDGFNSVPWETFDQMMGTELTRLKQYNKPIYILSMAAMNDTRKATWITDAFTTQLYKYPEVKGWVWFNENKEQDWRVNSNPQSLEAFKSMLP
jgi:hypothetical protein